MVMGLWGCGAVEPMSSLHCFVSAAIVVSLMFVDANITHGGLKPHDSHSHLIKPPRVCIGDDEIQPALSENIISLRARSLCAVPPARSTL